MPKLVLIGWHGADWRLIHPLVDAGLMPHLQSLIERGVIGNLRTDVPAIPAIAWTSLVTGRHPDEHSVLSSMEVDPCTGTVQRASSRVRQVKALWNIAMQSNLKPCVVDWLVTHPAEHLSGACVSEEFFRPRPQIGKACAVPDYSVYPPALEPEVSGLRFHGGELSGDDLLPFLPRLAEIDQEADGRVIEIADLIARAVSTHAVSTSLMEQIQPDLMMIGWNVIESACYQFQRYIAPQLPYVSAEDCARYGEAINGLYRYYDLMLGRILSLAGPETSIAVVSVSGFRTGAERPLAEGWREHPGAWLKPMGMFCLAGPQIRHEQILHGVSLLDIAPTILALLGLPAAWNMPGRVLAEAFSDLPVPPRVADWEAVAGPAGMHPVETEEEHSTRDAAISRLRTEGYTDPPHVLRAIATVESDRLLYSAFTSVGCGKYEQARTQFLELAAGSPVSPFQLWAAHCSLAVGDRAGCSAILKNLDRNGPHAAMACLMDAEVADTPALVSAAIERALALGSGIGYVNYMSGVFSIRLGKWKRAERLLRRAIEIDPVFQPAHSLLARLLAARGKRGDAVKAALTGLQLDNGSAHSQFALGLTLLFAGEERRALLALERASDLDSGDPNPRAWTSAIRQRRVLRFTPPPKPS